MLVPRLVEHIVTGAAVRMKIAQLHCRGLAIRVLLYVLPTRPFGAMLPRPVKMIVLLKKRWHGDPDRLLRPGATQINLTPREPHGDWRPRSVPQRSGFLSETFVRGAARLR